MGVTQREQRTGFRLPVTRSDGLAASIVYGGAKCQAAPRDISLNGILLHLHVAHAPALAQGDSVSVELVLGEKKAVLDGIVRRFADGRVGISSPASFKEGRPNPPFPHVGIYYDILTAWHARHMGQYTR